MGITFFIKLAFVAKVNDVAVELLGIVTDGQTEAEDFVGRR